MTKVVPKPKRKFVPPFLSGNLYNKSVQDILTAQATRNQQYTTATKSSVVTQLTVPVFTKPMPSSFGTSKSGGPILVDMSEDSQSDSDT